MATTHISRTGSPPPPTARPDPFARATALWAAAYGALALGWTVTGRGYPFAVDDSALLAAVPAELGAPIFAVGLLATAVLALAAGTGDADRVRGLGRGVLLTAGWTVAATLLVVVPDVSVLALTGYAPMLLLGLPFGWPDVDWSTVITWPLLNKTVCMAGGVLLAGTMLRWQRRTRSACASCGRSAYGDPLSPALRWAPLAVTVAVVVPLLYAGTRYAWLVGVPLGIDADALRELRASGGLWAGAGLATSAVVGAVLTLGLVQRWGEVFPRWIPGLAGRRVPVLLAVVPATYVALAVVAGGLGLLGSPEFARMSAEADLSIVPYLLWPVWGVALGTATYAYHVRRRGGCRVCGEGF